VSDPGSALSDLAGPPRDQAVSGLLEALAEALDSGDDVTPEPELRDPAGTVLREGALSLPRRSDLAVTHDGEREVHQLDAGEAPAGPKVALAAAGGFIAEIGPFCWDAADLTVYAGAATPDWAPLRRWFLEWFQSRHSEVAPDLLGAVHSLDGPWKKGRGWGFTVDFGSAPVACLAALITALADCGAARMRMGRV
jgi:hypothetical protein